MSYYNINLQVHYIPIHLLSFYKKKFHYKKGDYPEAEKFYAREISLPIYFDLKMKNVEQIIKLFKKFIQN